MPALSRRRRQEDAPYWPGFVDAMAQLLLVITFLLSVFMIAQFLLAREITGQDSALGQLRSQIAELTELLNLEKASKAEVEAQLARPDVAGVVVTHGTDTIDQTALFLDLTLSSDKPVVLVGAQRNASDPEPDGPRNLVDAVRQILDPQSAGQGVTVTMNQRINAARYVRKTHTNNVHTFTSGDLGPLGVHGEVAWTLPLTGLDLLQIRCRAASQASKRLLGQALLSALLPQPCAESEIRHGATLVQM